MKRMFDVVLALAAAVVLAAPVLLVALLVRLTSPGQALYWSNPVGAITVFSRCPNSETCKSEY